MYTLMDFKIIYQLSNCVYSQDEAEERKRQLE